MASLPVCGCALAGGPYELTQNPGEHNNDPPRPPGQAKAVKNTSRQSERRFLTPQVSQNEKNMLYVFVN
jgi:hypothetical protein